MKESGELFEVLRGCHFSKFCTQFAMLLEDASKGR